MICSTNKQSLKLKVINAQFNLFYLDEVERKPTESEKYNDDNHHLDHLSIKII